MGIKNLRTNPLVLTDSYNLSHQGMKINTDWEVSHLYNRKAGQILFGYHEAISTFLGDIRVTDDMIEEAMQVASRVGMQFPEQLFRRVVNECAGRIPLRVQALPEGTYCPEGTPFSQISNTKEGFGELVTYWEAIFLHTHFSSSCATEAWNIYNYLNDIRQKEDYSEDFYSRLTSFGFRGHRSIEDAYWAGSAWSLFFSSTDEFHIAYHRPEAGICSIPALAHKVVSQFDDEYESYKRAIDYAKETNSGIVAIVIDTYDAYNVINQMVLKLAEYAENHHIHIVLRPDSADTWQQTVDIYKIVRKNELKNVFVIIGESMNFERIKEADLYFQDNSVPLTFVNYGIGGGFYKHIDRDLLGYALKTAFSNKKNRMKFSNDAGKRSIPGRIALYYDSQNQMCVGTEDEIAPSQNLLKDIYHNEPISGPSLIKIRENALKQQIHEGQNDQSIIISQNILSIIDAFRKQYNISS